MQKGWIKLHRNILDWEWYSDINTFRLFTHILLRANHQPKTWRGTVIDRGQLWTSLDALSAETGLSRKQVRTSLERLKRTHELADKGHATGSTRGRMITVLKYDTYQDEGTQTDTQEGMREAGKGHAKGRQRAPTKECKNVKNEKNVKNTKRGALDFSAWPQMPSETILTDYKKLRAAKRASFTQTVVDSMAKQFQELAVSNITVDQTLTICCERGWQGLKAEWVLNHLNKQVGQPTPNDWDSKVQKRNEQLGISTGRVINHE